MAITLEGLEQLDQQLTLTINSWHSPFSDPIRWFFSDKKVWIPMYAAIIALMFWKLGWKRTLVLLVGVALTVLCCYQFSNLIKHWVERIRPVNDPAMIERGLHVLENGGGFSFFSSHAANAFGVSCCTVPVFRKYNPGKLSNIYTWWMLIWAFMVAISRIFVGKHFLGDVIVGIIVGICIGLIISRLINYVINRLKL